MAAPDPPPSSPSIPSDEASRSSRHASPHPDAPSRPPRPTTPQRPAIITLDLLLRVLHNTFFHPFIAWLLPLCLRAQATPYSHPSFILTAAYASVLTLLVLLSAINKRVAHGAPREVHLSKEVVVVAGGANGIGKIVAENYGMRGVSVAVVDVKGPDGGGGENDGHDREEEEAEIEDEEREMLNVRYYRGDVADRGRLEDVAKRIESDLGTPTILVNCIAAPIHGQPLMGLSESAVQYTIRSNLLSYFNFIQVFLPGLLTSPTGGTIVTVSSVLGYLHAAGLADYTATKAAVSAAHRSLEAELRMSGAQDKVKILLVETGQVATQLFENVETPNRFFAPILEPVEVARAMVSMIDSGNGGVLRLPAYASLVGWYTILPDSIQRLARYVSGIDTAIWNANFSSEWGEKSTATREPASETFFESEVESIDSSE